MASKKDPFNFDDIYKQAGVGDLFIKKSMGDMKKAAAPAPKPAAGAAPGGGGAAAAQKPVNGSIDAGFYSSSAPVKPCSSAGGSSDPFASLGFGSSIPAQPRWGRAPRAAFAGRAWAGCQDRVPDLAGHCARRPPQHEGAGRQPAQQRQPLWWAPALPPGASMLPAPSSQLPGCQARRPAGLSFGGRGKPAPASAAATAPLAVERWL
jgi:hypothetical protein